MLKRFALALVIAGSTTAAVLPAPAARRSSDNVRLGASLPFLAGEDVDAASPSRLPEQKPAPAVRGTKNTRHALRVPLTGAGAGVTFAAWALLAATGTLFWLLRRGTATGRRGFVRRRDGPGFTST